MFTHATANQPRPPSSVPGPASIPPMRSPVTAHAPTATTSRDATTPTRLSSTTGGKLAPLRGELRAPSSRCLMPCGLVLIVAVPPGRWDLQSFLVATERRHVQEPVGTHQLLDPALIGGVGVVHDPVLE